MLPGRGCPFQSLSRKHFTSFRNLGCRLHASSGWPVHSIAHMWTLKLLTQAEAPSIYMYNVMVSVLAYCHRFPMPLEYFVHLVVGLIHVIYNNDNIWTMCNLHTQLGAQQGFRHELATKYAFLIHSKTKKVVIIDARTVWSWCGGHWVQTECNHKVWNH